MKVLLVEDEDRSARQALELIHGTAPGSLVEVASNRDEALEAMDGSGFDLIICDLRIPPSKLSVDVDEAHGLAVHAAARRCCPGTPLIILTAFATPRNTRSQLSSGGIQHVYGLKDYPMVQLVEKDDLDELEDHVRTINHALNTLDEFSEISFETVPDEMFLRAVRTYAYQIDMPRAVVHNISGGLSGAPLGRVELSSPQGGEANIFMKVVPYGDAAKERLSFEEFVPNRLQAGYFAPALSPIAAGLQGRSALMSSLADGCVSLFELLKDDPTRAAGAVKALRKATRPWVHASDPVPITLGDLRRRRITDARLAEAVIDIPGGLNCDESVSVIMKSRICHGDLHGENILVTAEGRPILIDFGDLGLNVAPLDPITLELSIIFHKAGPARSEKWFANANWESWADLDTFVQDSPFELFIRECRAWSMEQDTSNSVFASAYAHAVRQFKYLDVDKAIAAQIAKSAYAAISANTPT